MKKLLSILIVIGLLTGCVTTKSTIAPKPDATYTYEGDVDPEVFMNWNRSDVEFFTDGENNYAQFKLPNPDHDSPISQVVAVVVVENNNMTLIAYGYNKNGIDYVYALDLEKNHYFLLMSRPSIGHVEELKWTS